MIQMMMIAVLVCFCCSADFSAQANPLSLEKALSFENALQEILSRDTTIQTAEGTKRATEGQNISKRFHLFPTLSLEGNRGRESPGNDTESVLGVARMSLFKFGADLAALDAARAQESAAQSRVDQSRLDRETWATQKMVTYIRLSLESEVLTQLEKMNEDSLQVADRQYKGGRISLQEMQKVEIDLENVRFRIGEANTNRIAAQAEVHRLLGHSEIEITWPWKEKIKNKNPASLQAKDFWNQRPDFRVAAEDFEAQDRLRAKAFRNLFPEFGARFTYGFTKNYVTGNQFQKGWSGLLTLSIPIFNRFEDYSTYQYQTATRDIAETAHEEVKRKIWAEFDSVPARFQTAQKNALARDRVLKTSNRLYQDNLARFRLGRATSNELNVDLNRYLNTELNAISAWAAAHLVYVDLIHLIGQSVLLTTGQSGSLE